MLSRPCKASYSHTSLINYFIKTLKLVSLTEQAGTGLAWLKIGMFFSHEKAYRKVPKFWDARNLCCNQAKIQTKRPNLKEIGLQRISLISEESDWRD